MRIKVSYKSGTNTYKPMTHKQLKALIGDIEYKQQIDNFKSLNSFEQLEYCIFFLGYRIYLERG